VLLEVLVGASARSAVLVAAVWLILLPPPMRRRQIHSIAWTVVLVASLPMPVATWLAAIAPRRMETPSGEPHPGNPIRGTASGHRRAGDA
jgi:hypothetical protein